MSMDWSTTAAPRRTELWRKPPRYPTVMGGLDGRSVQAVGLWTRLLSMPSKVPGWCVLISKCVIWMKVRIYLLKAELCPLQIHMLKPYPSSLVRMWWYLFIMLFPSTLSFLFYTEVYSQLTMLWQFRVNSGSQPHAYMYPFSPKTLLNPGCHVTLSRRPWAIQ